MLYAKEIFSNFEILGVKPENIILIGDSAGGNLAAAVSLLARDRKEFYPSKQILIYPATAADHSRTSPFESVRENGTGYLLTSKARKRTIWSFILHRMPILKILILLRL